MHYTCWIVRGGSGISRPVAAKAPGSQSLGMELVHEEQKLSTILTFLPRAGTQQWTAYAIPPECCGGDHNMYQSSHQKVLQRDKYLALCALAL